MSQINLSQLKKCPESWHKMSQVQGGRLCASCNKVIVDFRKKSNDEILRTHLNNEMSVCGLYSKDQLEQQTPDSSKHLKSLAIIGLSSLSLIQLAQAQNTRPHTHQTSNTAKTEKDLIKTLPISTNPAIQDSVVIYGRVTEKTAQGKSGIPYATLYIPQYNLGVTTDLDGYYEINLTDSVKVNPQPISLTVQYIGYAKRTITGIEPTESKEIDFDLDQKELEMVAFGVVVQPFHKRVWLNFKSLFKREK